MKLILLIGLFTSPLLGQSTGVVEPSSELNAIDTLDSELPGSSESLEAKKSDELTWESAPDADLDSAYGRDVTNSVRIEEVVQPSEEYRYAAFGKEDPFVPPFAYVLAGLSTVEVNESAGFEIPIVSPLQTNLENLSVGGIWELDDGQKRALVLIKKSGQGIIAKIGDPFGLSGKVIDITPAGVVARQYRLRSDGAREYEDKLLELGPQKIETEANRIFLKPGEDPKFEGSLPGKNDSLEFLGKPTSDAKAGSTP